MNLDIKEILQKSKETLKNNEEYKGEYKDYEIDYILEDMDNTNDSIIIASDGGEIIQVNPFKNEIMNIADWTYDIDQDVFGELEKNKKIVYMHTNMHYGLWSCIEEYYPEDIENKKRNAKIFEIL